MRRSVLILLVLLLAALCLIVFYYAFRPKESSERKAVLAALSTNTPLSLSARSKQVGCIVRGAFPDPDCTPGAVFREATVKDICTPGYSKSVRSVSQNAKMHIYAMYGIDYPQPQGSYEADHLIPLELGGNNEFDNLFPESAAPIPGFHEKDLVENYLHNKVCRGEFSLSAVQMYIAHNWLAVYNILTPEEIQQLKDEQHSYSD